MPVLYTVLISVVLIVIIGLRLWLKPGTVQLGENNPPVRASSSRRGALLGQVLKAQVEQKRNSVTEHTSCSPDEILRRNGG